jgi:hypothetical protein
MTEELCNQVIEENMLRSNISAANCLPMTADKLEEIRVRLCVRWNTIHRTPNDTTCKHAKPLAVERRRSPH